MRLPDDVIREVFPWEEFTLARSLVDNGVPEGEFEDDLFAGLRDRSRRSCLTDDRRVRRRRRQEGTGAALGAVDDGAVVERGDGAPPSRPTSRSPRRPADAQALHDGTLDLSVGFIRGQVKMAGDFGTLLQFLPLTAGERRSCASPTSSLPAGSPRTTRLTAQLAAHERRDDPGAALAVEAQVADPRDLAASAQPAPLRGRRTPRPRPRSRRRRVAASGRSPSDRSSPRGSRSGSRSRSSRRRASRAGERGAERRPPDRAPGPSAGYATVGESCAPGAGLAFDRRRPAGGVAPERRRRSPCWCRPSRARSRSVSSSIPARGVGDVDARARGSAGSRSRAAGRARRARARARSTACTSSLPRPATDVGMHGHEHEPRRDVLAEPLGLHHRRAALVAEHSSARRSLRRSRVRRARRRSAAPPASRRRTAPRARRESRSTLDARCSLR